jgi:hypothetical protein
MRKYSNLFQIPYLSRSAWDFFGKYKNTEDMLFAKNNIWRDKHGISSFSAIHENKTIF